MGLMGQLAAAEKRIVSVVGDRVLSQSGDAQITFVKNEQDSHSVDSAPGRKKHAGEEDSLVVTSVSCAASASRVPAGAAPVGWSYRLRYNVHAVTR